MSSSSKRFLLVGSPNSGKTSMFNRLTGLHQKTANYTGVTIEKHIGTFYCKNELIELVDLPGIYSLYSTAVEEQLAIREILSGAYDGIILVANADQLQKNLLLILQVLDLKKPSLLILNMIDEAYKKNILIQTNVLQSLLNVNVIPVSARYGNGLDKLKDILFTLSASSSVFYDWNTLNKHASILKNVKDYYTWIDFYTLHKEEHPNLQAIVNEDIEYKRTLIHYIATKSIKTSSFFSKRQFLIDKYLTHKIWGFVFLILTLFITFQVLFFVAEYPMQWIEWVLGSFSEWLDTFLPNTEWANLILNGIIPGITGVVMFVPQITLLFLMIGILEESGYMARVSFLLDSVFHKFGLSGKSLIPLMSGTACAVPSIMSARTINNLKEKLITILVLPFMSCSARLPVYTLLIGLLFPDNTEYLFFNLKGLLLLGLYLFGLTIALLYAWLFHKIIQHQENSFFFIELPSYKIPYWKNLVITIWNKVRVFITDAGKIIVAISIVLWYLSTHTFPSVQKEIQQKYLVAETNDSLKKMYQKEILETSYIGIIGKKIEPLISPLGYDWKIGIALITSFAAREVFVGTMATLYSSETNTNVSSLREKIRVAQNPDNGEKVFSVATNVSLLIYYALAMQCISTMVIVYKELKSLKWTIIQFILMTGTAYILAFVTYQILH